MENFLIFVAHQRIEGEIIFYYVKNKLRSKEGINETCEGFINIVQRAFFLGAKFSNEPGNIDPKVQRL